MNKLRNSIAEEVRLLMLKVKRIDTIIDFQETLLLNVGNYWVKQKCRQYIFPFVNETDESFGRVMTGKKEGHLLFSEDHAIYFDVIAECHDNSLTWCFSIDAEYYEKLHFPENMDFIIQENQFCLCTVVRLDTSEKIKSDFFLPAIQYAKQKDFKIVDKPRALLVGRGYNNENFCRYFEIQIPIEKNSETVS